MKTAVITGVLGQDGAYLAKFLLEKNYKVYGLVKKASILNTKNLLELKVLDDVELVQGDVTDESSTSNLIRKVVPDEFYNLAAQSNANASWELSRYTSNINAMGALNVLDALRNNCPECRYFQAGSSDQFGNNSQSPVDEQTAMSPENPYAVSKVFAHYMTNNYRAAHGLHASNGILFNHESPLRAQNFILSKMVHSAVRIYLKQQTTIKFGSIDVVRDWGYAPDFVEAMWMMLQQDFPDDYMVCTGRPASFEELLGIIFSYLGLNTWQQYIQIDSALARPTEVLVRYGNPAYTQKKIGWTARTSLEDMLHIMIDHAFKTYT